MNDIKYRFLITSAGDLLIFTHPVILVQPSNNLGEKWFQKLSGKERQDKRKITTVKVLTKYIILHSGKAKIKRTSQTYKIWRY